VLSVVLDVLSFFSDIRAGITEDVMLFGKGIVVVPFVVVVVVVDG